MNTQHANDCRCASCIDRENRPRTAPEPQDGDEALEEILLLVDADGEAKQYHFRNFKQPDSFETWKTARRALVAALRAYKAST